MKAVKRIAIMILLSIGFAIAPTQKSHAVIWVVVKAAIKKVIKALDLQVQRLQNKTIGLQNAQKALENSMSKLQLDQITNWVRKHKEQYEQYFDELHKVKDAVSSYKKVREIMDKQGQIVDEYKRTYSLFLQDKRFTNAELDYILKVYTGIIDESLKNIDQLFLVINSFKTEMTDGKRLQIINGVAGHIDNALNDLREFNVENIRLSLQRARDGNEIQAVKILYGLN